ncbi:MAG: DUF2817 domain-containing protein [Gemmatimonadota bacterium]|nr:DUF2817 domain-containing protein [Gemmatimonadota bacterium]
MHPGSARSASSVARFAAFLFVACGLFSWPAGAAPIPVDSHGLPLWEIRVYEDFPVRIEVGTGEELNALLERVPVASFHREQLRVEGTPPKHLRLVWEPRVTESEAEALRRAGVSFERIPDREKQARREMERVWEEQALAGGDRLLRGDTRAYHTHAQIGTELQQTELDHPAIARFHTIGSSVQGRELWAIEIGDNVGVEEAEPEVRLTSTMHGNEPPGLEMLMYLVEHLTDNYGSDPDVTYLVDNYEIHIIPCHNPDGLTAGSRYNANGVDLNRNYPVPDGSVGEDGTYASELETTFFKAHGAAHHFVISENGHSGALVVNYPWDYSYALTPDDSAIIKLSLEYSTYNLPMYNGSFSQGITNGAQWYVVHGSLQDWSYQDTGCIDVTIEYSDSYSPPSSQLPQLWNENRESFLHFIKSARYGVNGIVTGSDTGLPLDATVTVSGNAKSVVTDPDFGDYYKLIPTGTYDITFAAGGYITKTEYGVSSTWGTPTVLNVALDPVASGDVSGFVQEVGGTPLTATVEVRTYPVDSLVTSVQSDGGAGGAYTVNLVYGDYRFLVSAPDHVTANRIVTVDAASVTENFILGGAEEVVLFQDDFEAGSTGAWSLSGGSWGISTVAYNSTRSMTDSPSTTYANLANTSCAMASPVDLGGVESGTVSFFARWSIEDSWDCVQFQVSTDGGGAWTAVSTPYTTAGSGQGAQPSGEPVFEGSQSAWVENSVDLAPWIGLTNVRFRFQLMSDSSVRKDGIYFDDFEIRVVQEIATGVAVAGLGGGLTLENAPNPFRSASGTAFAFSLPAKASVRIAIHDAAGRLLRTLVEEELAAGEHVRPWDGRDDDGCRVAAGVYFASVEAAGARIMRKVVLTR